MTGKYGLVVMNILRAAAGLTVLALGLFMALMFLRERKQASDVSRAAGIKAH
jgi:hypothetical protein